jgi:RimJ/RimL family protein N-acetyltransferase
MSDELGLRDVRQSDLEVFLAYENDPEAFRRSKFPPRDREQFMRHWTTEILGDATVFVQTVVVDGEPAGNVIAWWEEDRRFIGYWFGRRYWGRGIGTKALAMFLARERIRPLYADPFTGNTASVRLLEKSGFRHLGALWHGEHEHVLLQCN